MKKLKTFYPILLVMFPILSLFSHNMGEVPIIDLALPLIIAIVGILLLLSLPRLFTKNYKKIALVLSLAIVIFFSYGYVRDAIPAMSKTTFLPNAILLSVWLALFIIGVFLIIKACRDFAILTKFLSIMAVVLVLVPLGSISINEIKSSFEHRDINGNVNNSGLINSDSYPDIYYIILDMYARNDGIKERFGYDNSEFTNYLSDKGFYIATESYSNYSSTYQSLSSSLNMDYRESINLGDNILAMIEKMKDSEASKFLKSKGYRYIYVTGGIPLHGMEEYADVYSYSGVFGIRVSDFAQSLCDTTILSPLARIVGGLYGANSVLYAFDALAEIPEIDESTFVYSHIMCPHPPWFFDSSGAKEFSPFGTEQNDMVEEGYLGNLVFLNNKLKILIDRILSESTIPPIIILQGDHGLWWAEDKLGHFAILNAYYIPGMDNQLLYESISPVNSFRVIFNLYFGSDYELLEDRR